VVGNICKIHIALHGCFQEVYNEYEGIHLIEYPQRKSMIFCIFEIIIYFSFICNVFATHSGYFQVADSNDVVVVFPQAAALEVSLITTQTNFGCWDFYGGVSPDFCTKI